MNQHLNSEFQGIVKWKHAHSVAALWLAVFIVIGVVIGPGAVVVAQRYGAQYFASHYTAPLKLPPQGISAPGYAGTLKTGSLTPKAPSSCITWRWEPPIGDQGYLNSCEGWSASSELSHIYNKRHGTHWRLSPRWTWQQATGCYDGPSVLAANLLAVERTGVPRNKDYGYPPNILNCYVPPNVYGLALKQKATVSVHWICLSQNCGYGALAQAEALSRKYDVGAHVVIPVCTNWMNARYNPWIDKCVGTYYGAHAISILCWYPRWVHNGVRGWVRVENSYGPQWGDHGYAFYSLRGLAHDGFEMGVISLDNSNPVRSGDEGAAASTNGKQPRVYRNPNPGTTVPPPAGASRIPIKASHLSWRWINHVHLYNNARDTQITTEINYWSSKTGVWAPIIAAMIFTESGGDPFSHRIGDWCDVSFGLTQLTVCTAATYGVGHGTPADIPYNRWYFYHYKWAIRKGSQVLADDERITGLGNIPNIYIAYNSGPGWGLSWYTYPQGQALTNYRNFIGWYHIALAHWASPVRPYLHGGKKR